MIVILGGIAVSSVTRVFVLQKIRGIAVLKCLGATSGQIIAVYLLQVMSLGLAGSLLGVAIAQGAVAAIPLALGSSSTTTRLCSPAFTTRSCGGWRFRARRSACSCRCSLRSSRCSRCGSSSRRCSCATKRRRRAATRRASPPWSSCRRPWSRSPPGRPPRSAWGSSSASGLRCWRSCWCMRAGCSWRWSRRSRTRRRSRCGTPCCTCPARQPDARHSAGRRPRRVLHRRRAVAAGEPARGVLDSGRRGRGRHVPARRPARPGRRHARVSERSRKWRGIVEAAARCCGRA